MVGSGLVWHWLPSLVGVVCSVATVVAVCVVAMVGDCCQNGFDGWDGKGCWYGCVLYRRGKRIGRNGCLSDLYLPLPLPLGGLSLLAFLETGWERMSVS